MTRSHPPVFRIAFAGVGNGTGTLAGLMAPYPACVRQTCHLPDMHRAYARQVLHEPAGSTPMKPHAHGRIAAYHQDHPPHTGDSYEPVPPHLPHARQKAGHIVTGGAPTPTSYQPTSDTRSNPQPRPGMQKARNH